MKKIKNIFGPLTIPLISLLILFLFTRFSNLIITNCSFNSFCSDISIEILGAIITILLIDFSIKRREERIAEKREQIALSLLKPIIRNNLTLLFNLYKATTDIKGSNYTQNELKNLFNSDYIETIQKLDITKNAPIYPDTNWINYLKAEFSELNRRYETVLDKYSFVMPPDIVQEIENIKNSIFHQNMIINMPNILNYWSSLGKTESIKNMFGQVFSEEYVVEPYLKKVVFLLDILNKFEYMKDIYKVEDGEWRNDISPKIGESKI